MTSFRVDRTGLYLFVGPGTAVWSRRADPRWLAEQQLNRDFVAETIRVAVDRGIDSGAAFERYLDERFPDAESRAAFDAKVEEISRASASGEERGPA